jgi:hypothetical protein
MAFSPDLTEKPRLSQGCPENGELIFASPFNMLEALFDFLSVRAVS